MVTGTGRLTGPLSMTAAIGADDAMQSVEAIAIAAAWRRR